jgi:hypothetical protein
MKIDLAAALRKQNPAAGHLRAVWRGVAAIDVDEDVFVGRTAGALAFAMGAHLHRGRRTDGRGAMPARQKDGRPRGVGSQIAMRITAQQVRRLTWRIAPPREIPGHLARIMQASMGPALCSAGDSLLVHAGTTMPSGLQWGRRSAAPETARRKSLVSMRTCLGGCEHPRSDRHWPLGLPRWVPWMRPIL